MKKWLLLFVLLAIGGIVMAAYPPPPAPGYVYNSPFSFPTFAATTQVTSNGAGDIYCLQGSNQAVIRLTGFGLSAIANGPSPILAEVILRSTIDPGGSPVQITPYDSGDPNAPQSVASAMFYNNGAATTAPQIGIIRMAYIMPAPASGTGFVSAQIFQFRFQPLTLRGTQAACINVSAGGAGTKYAIDGEHTENAN